MSSRISHESRVDRGKRSKTLTAYERSGVSHKNDAELVSGFATKIWSNCKAVGCDLPDILFSSGKSATWLARPEHFVPL